MTTDDEWMRQALAQAHLAAASGEVPVGAVLVKDGVVIATGRNAPVQSHDPSAHAEINALRAGGAALGNYRLDGCELFVTLEPCAMCAGAMLHSRLARVVYGAPDPRAGAAGSLLNLFEHTHINHHTHVRGGVLAAQCTTVLRDFFKERREQARAASQPLRDDALRTPEKRFIALADDYPVATYVSGLPSQHGWRMHYVDAGPRDAVNTVLCLHAPGQWSYFFRHVFLMRDVRWLAPDLIGFGKSDKPKRDEVHRWTWHCDVLLEWLESLHLGPVSLIYANGIAPLAELIRSSRPKRFTRITFEVPEVLDGSALDAWHAPFPDRGHEAAVRAFGCGEDRTSGPSIKQAEEIAARVTQHDQNTVGYCRP